MQLSGTHADEKQQQQQRRRRRRRRRRRLDALANARAVKGWLSTNHNIGTSKNGPQARRTPPESQSPRPPRESVKLSFSGKRSQNIRTWVTLDMSLITQQ